MLTSCGSDQNADPTVTPLSTQPASSPTPIPTTATQQQEPHIPFPTETPTPVPTPTPTPGPWGEGPLVDPDARVEAELKLITAQVSELRGLEVLEDPLINLVTSEELADLIEEIIAEWFTAEDAAILQQLYLALDFLDEDDDLFQMVSDLYSGQVVGFYDDDTDEMFVSNDGPQLDFNSKSTFAHELVHGLQDQHFDLDLFLPEDSDNYDMDQARRALVEGDASLLTWDYIRKHLTWEERVLTQADTAFEEPARILREELAFPYVQGSEFVYALFQYGSWEAVDAAYQDPPQSTEQILHPEKYLEREAPVQVLVPELAPTLGDTWTLLDAGVLGEFVLTIYLENQLSPFQAARASEGWGGDRYRLVQDESTGERLLTILSAWDTETDAIQFFQAYAEYIDRKSVGEWTLGLGGAQRRWWEAADNSVYLSRLEDRVLVIVGQTGEAVDTVLTSFPGY